MKYSASAPGKLVLVGEYAVLSGAPAISAAVNLRAAVTLQPASGALCELRIANSAARYEFGLGSDAAPEWAIDPGDQGALLTAALEILAARGLSFTGLPPFSVELCSRSFYADQDEGQTKNKDAGSATESAKQLTKQSARKIGIGSSAAVTVALVAALQSYLGRQPALADCLEAHRCFQQGKGSGLDIATSWYGGVIAMQGHQGNSGAAPLVQQLVWPEGLHVVPVWTGEPASTRQMLDRLDLYSRQSIDTCQQFMQRLGVAAQAALDHWQAGSAGAVINALENYSTILAALDSAAGLGIWSAPHYRLAEIAKTSGVSYKPSGAGGGDFGLGFSTDRVRLNDFMARANTHVATQVQNLGWTDRGLVVNETVVAALS